MTKKHDYPWVSTLGAAVVAIGLMSGCRIKSLLTSPNPLDEITGESINSPSAARQAFLAAVGQLTEATASGSYTIGTGLFYWTQLLSDEYSNQFVQAGTSSVDARLTSLLEAGGNESGDGPLSALVQARSALLLTVAPLNSYESGEQRGMAGEAYALAGYAELLLAEDFCAGVPLSRDLPSGGVYFGRPLSTQALLDSAASTFRLAEQYAYTNDTALNLARVGLGRAFLDLGKVDSAAAAVDSVPTSFVYSVNLQLPEASGQINSALPGVSFYSATIQYYETFEFGVKLSNQEGGVGINYITASDPRLVFDSTSYQTLDDLYNEFYGSHFSDSIWYWPLKFGSSPMNVASFPLATGVEARLIQAEALLPANGGTESQWLAAINTLRGQGPDTYLQSTMTVSPLTDPDSTASDSAQIAVMFRERAFWLFGLGNRLGDMRREVRQYGQTYGFTVNGIYPSGPYPQVDPTDSVLLFNEIGAMEYSSELANPWQTYGPDVDFTLPTSAANLTDYNTNYQGCIVPTSQP